MGLSSAVTLIKTTSFANELERERIGDYEEKQSQQNLRRGNRINNNDFY